MQAHENPWEKPMKKPGAGFPCSRVFSERKRADYLTAIFSQASTHFRHDS